ncbi:PilW family protein [Amantichitinum ursilacus]|uniref:Uncharacterized protein n=1 Tax=Amantichitinum ursilacus TaxID=857265 RepID=A0A0N0XIC6_9NEIS|nr:PilW family protein [Amantichitinum ursilacus]KPC52146.1 hypothetical protein WG78_13840 [Amantichitinum ursilacus]
MAAIPRRQRGIGMIELLIGLAISLLLMIGLGTVYFSMRTSSTARDAYSQIQDAQRTSMNLLAAFVQQAGYFIVPPVTNTAATVFPVATGFTVAGTYISGSANTFTIRYVVGTNPLSTCSGVKADTGRIYVDTFSVTTTSGVSSLTCVETVGTGSAATYLLVNNVSSMNLQYAIDTTGDGTAFQYTSGGASTSWLNARAIKVTLNYANPLAGQTGQPATIPFTRVIALMNTL